MREIIKVVKEKLVAKYLKDGSIKNYSKKAKKFKPRIKARVVIIIKINATNAASSLVESTTTGKEIKRFKKMNKLFI